MNTYSETINPITSGQLKLIRSLQQKKIRERERLFVAEGEKIVMEYFHAARENFCSILFICISGEWHESHKSLFAGSGIPVAITDRNMIRKVSSLVSPQEILAVISMNDDQFDASILKADMTIALESVRDPGNLGTIIRTADWFGFRSVICSEDSVDVYNPKVIQAAMGSTLRVNTYYMDLHVIIRTAEEMQIPVYCTSPDGRSVYEESFPEGLIMLFGNESSGITNDLMDLAGKKVTIPRFPLHSRSAESLNLATSVAVVAAEIRRRSRKSYSK